MAALNAQLDLPALSATPEYSPALDQVLEKLPPRNSTLIRAASMYSRDDIPWIEHEATHQLCAEGYPVEGKFFVTVAPSCKDPEQRFRLGAYFALKPPAGIRDVSASVSSVIATFGGEMKTDTFGFGALVDTVAQSVAEVYGSLAPPWDTAPGVYNHHDDVARDSFRHELPALDEKFHEYFQYRKSSMSSTVPAALTSCSTSPARSAPTRSRNIRHCTNVPGSRTCGDDGRYVLHAKADYWMRSGFDRGRVWMIFMVRGGELSTFDAAYHPVGQPLAMESLRHGLTHTHTTIRIRRLGMTFGLDNLNFGNYFTRDDSTVTFQSHMDAVPMVVVAAGDPAGRPVRGRRVHAHYRARLRRHA